MTMFILMGSLNEVPVANMSEPECDNVVTMRLPRGIGHSVRVDVGRDRDRADSAIDDGRRSPRAIE